MELQSQVRVYNEALGVKGARGKLVQIHKEGFFEIALEVKERYFNALLPISGTIILAAEPLQESETIEVEHY